MHQQQSTLTYLAITQLVPNRRNSRTHTKHQIRQIAESIRTFGFTNPVLIDRNDQIVAGHGRVEAAKLLSMSQVPTIRLENLTEDQIRAYVLADNKLAENAGWDRSILAIELQNLLTLDGAEFDVTITGFEVPEIDLIIEEAKDEPEPEPEGDSPEPDLSFDPVTQAGDAWILNRHRLLCGNSLRDGTYKQLMGKRRASVAFTDPPFNVRIDGHATGKGSIHHREFQMASGEMSETEFLSFLNSSLRFIANYSSNGAVSFICMDWRHAGDLISAGRQNFNELLNLCVWVKNSGGMGSLYRSQHELVMVFRKGKGRHLNNVQLGKFGRNRTNVWLYPGIQTMSKQGDEGNLLALHPTVKPIAMVADAILDCSVRGDIVLDPFLGSGTTLMAAERVGRICHGIEIDPLYVDVAIRRWQKHTGERAIHSETGKSFDEIAAEGETKNA
jgi:DNA modification methylase